MSNATRWRGKCAVELDQWCCEMHKDTTSELSPLKIHSTLDLSYRAFVSTRLALLVQRYVHHLVSKAGEGW